MKKIIIIVMIFVLFIVQITTVAIFFYLFLVIMTLFVIIAAIELIRMYEKEKKFDKGIALVIVLLTVASFLSVGGVFSDIQSPGNEFWRNPLEDIRNQLTIVTLIVTIVTFSLLVFSPNFGGADVGKVLTVVNYVALGAASVMILRVLGTKFIVYLLLISTVTDMGAYFFGIKFGRKIFGPKGMAPNISPKKSWEGAIAGTLLATIIASSFALFYGVFFPSTGFLGNFLNSNDNQTILDGFSSLGEESRGIQALILIPVTLIASIVGQIGDLVASKLKRTYDIKDFGSVFPGHGGVLDRFDSIFFVAMFLAAIFLWVSQSAPLVPFSFS